MFKRLGLILTVLFIYGCSDFVDAINNFQLPAWETEMSFQIHEDVIRIAEEINDSLILAYDCQDTTMCDTSRGQIYMIELSKDIKTDSVGNLIKFED